MDELSQGSSTPQEPARVKRSRKQVFVFILPSLFTTANIFCGFYSMIAAIREDWVRAAIAIILAGFFDIIDGRVARFAKAQSEFGEQYDSMADLVSFGVAPTLLMHQWAFQPYGRVGWLVAFMYLCCAALRLARFNVLKQSAEKRYFQGCPSPVAALTVATAVLNYHSMEFEGGWRGIFMLVVLGFLGAAMISTIRYRSFKDVAFKSGKRGLGFFVTLIGAILVISTAPEKFLFPLFIIYLGLGALAEAWRFIRKKPVRKPV